MWWEMLWVGLALLLLVVVPLALLGLRRRWLGGMGGTFDCAHQLYGREPGVGWSLGVARYRGEQFEWFRSFSLSLRPRLSLTRSRTHYVSRRPTAGTERVVLFQDSCVVTVCDDDGTVYRLGMTTDSAMALISWLESAPPGIYLPYSGS